MRSLLVCLLVLLAAPARAWYSAGHRLIALLAYERLAPEARAAYVELLAHHPRFAEDFLAAMPPEVAGSPDTELRARWIFARASEWPDVARGFGEPERARYHRGTWHYTNGVLFLSAEDEAHFAELDVARSAGPEGSGEDPLAVRHPLDGNRALHAAPGSDPLSWNLMQALDEASRRLADRSAPEAERAVALCWILHLVGDLHQPLHSASLWSRTLFPEGDRGGNDVPLLGLRPNLHAAWDGALGSIEALSELDARVQRWTATPEFARLASEAATEREPSRWLLESYAAAARDVYTAEVLGALAEQSARPASSTSREPAGPQPIALSVRYRVRSYDLARERAAAAGARLGALLAELAPSDSAR